jgi:Chemotaxis phosphatase CheX
MSTSVPLHVWQAAVEGGVMDLARDGMGFTDVELTGRSDQIPEEMPGAFIPLIAEAESVQVGIVSTPAGCLALARAMLQGGDDLQVSPTDMTDAMSESANILAGFVKRGIHDHLHPVQLGLPLFVNGHLETTDRVRALVTHFRLGSVKLAVVVLRAAEWKAVAAPKSQAA